MSAMAAQVASTTMPSAVSSATAAPVTTYGLPGVVTYLPPQPAVFQQPYMPQGQAVVYVDESGNRVAMNQMQQPVQYVDENGNPVDMSQMQQPVQYVDEYGNPVDVGQMQQPVQYVDENGNPVDIGQMQQP